DESPEHALRFGDDVIDVDDTRLKDLLAAEQEQLPRQASRALAGLAYLLEQLARFLLRLLLQHQRGAAVDHREQVVEVMRDATRQPADRFHLLGVTQLLFEPAALRDVADDDQHDVVALSYHARVVHARSAIGEVQRVIEDLHGASLESARDRFLVDLRDAL